MHNPNDVPQDMWETLDENRYRYPVVVNGKICALSQQFTTVGIVIGIDPTGYECRFCYKEFQDAKAALEEMARIGAPFPDGPWLKAKGSFQGHYVDLNKKDFLAKFGGPNALVA